MSFKFSVWCSQPPIRGRTSWNRIKICPRCTAAEWLDVSQPRCFTYSSLTSKSSCNFRSPLESVPRGSARPQRSCHHSKYQTPKATQQEENAKRPIWEGPRTTRGKHWYYYRSLPLIRNHNFSPCKTLIFVTINWKWCQHDTFFPGLHLLLNRYWYREIPRLLHTAAVWFIPWSNMSRQAWRGYWATVHCAQARKAEPGVNETQTIWFPSAFVVTDEGRPHPDQSQVQRHKKPHAAFVPLTPELERSPKTLSLQVSSRGTCEIYGTL